MISKNDASQTLFRFVSLRNPKLTEIKTKNLGFIQRPTGIVGIFDRAVINRVPSVSKIEAMEDLIYSGVFESEAFVSEKELETGQYSELLTIGKKIARNEFLTDTDWKYTKNYYTNLVDSNGELKNENLNSFDQLWNNLIYQVISQKDFYVKEAISHVLKAIHFGFAQFINNVKVDKEVIAIALNSKIVLPKELFANDDYGAPSATESNTKTSLDKVTNQRLIANAKSNLLVQNATYKKEALKKLHAELEKIKKSYFTSNNKSYQKTYAEYQVKYKTELDNYQKISREIDQLIELKTSEKDLEKVYEKLNLLNIPQFEFIPDDQIDIIALRTKLSFESFDLFIEIFSDSEINIAGNLEILSSKAMNIGDTVYEIDSTLETFDDLLSIVKETLSLSIQTALDNTKLPQQQYINLEGATIPIIQNFSRTPLAYSFIVHNAQTTLDTDRGFLSFSFEVEDATYEVASAIIIINTDLGTFEENHIDIAVTENKILLPKLFVNKFKSINNVKIELIFKNGIESFAEMKDIINGKVYTGILVSKPTNNNRGRAKDKGSKRNNFGIKRVGVADYLKVVQTVHAYVPGLVSNIENVMASELRHKSSIARDYSEITDTNSKYQETEKVSDTSKTSRTDMQTEIAKELDRQQSITAHTRFSYDSKVYKFEVGSEFANNTAQHDSTRQAVMKSQEITEKAMESVLNRISEERVQKIIKEYTETNVHEFDNRGKITETNNPADAQPKHITGVYRWIDMKYKNQIYNYSIRTMFEFMVPEPAKLHRLALSVSKGHVLTAPIDPRKALGEWNMVNSEMASVEVMQHWAALYKVTLTSIKMTDTQTVACAYHFDYGGDCPVVSAIFTVNENYICKSITVFCNFWKKTSGGTRINIDGGYGIYDIHYPAATTDLFYFGGLNLTGSFNYKHSGRNIGDITHELTLNLEINPELVKIWKADNYQAIIKAYDNAYAIFLQEQAKLDEAQAIKEKQQKKEIGQYYRYMEQDVIKHNCIAYLLQDYLYKLGIEFTSGDKIENLQVHLGEDLDQYTALAKFMEQAFE